MMKSDVPPLLPFRATRAAPANRKMTAATGHGGTKRAAAWITRVERIERRLRRSAGVQHTHPVRECLAASLGTW